MTGPLEVLRAQALDVFRAALDAADPARAVRRALAFRDGTVIVGGRPLEAIRRIRCAAFGKAAPAMAGAAEEILPQEVFPGPGIAVTTYGSARPLRRFRAIEAGHPLPDARGVEGARAVAACLAGAREDELALVLVSGGGSALLPAPAGGISLEDKIAATRLLMAAGADIRELNTVRKHISALKGGGLARIAAPAVVRALVLSDVLGDDQSVIASGPLSPDPSTFADAVDVLRRRGLLDRVSPPVRRRLEAGLRGEVPETPKPGDPVFEKVTCEIVGSNRRSVEAGRERAMALGLRARSIEEPIAGEAREAAARIAAEVEALARGIRGGSPAPVCLVGGGETTVTVRGGGRGGRNGELALTFAIEMERRVRDGDACWVFLAAGTDGIDGPTDSAGGLVDPGTIGRMRAAGIDPREALEDNDSHTALDAAGDLLRTGPTGTNVADIAIFIAR
jgi:glycerate 2-kinase